MNFDLNEKERIKFENFKKKTIFYDLDHKQIQKLLEIEKPIDLDLEDK